jgi:SAM-dependent methyltransferase
MGAVLLGFVFLQDNRRDAALVSILLVPLLLLLHEPVERDREIHWTPYQEVEFSRRYTLAGDLWGGAMEVNHTLYQSIVNLSPQFLARHPALRREAENSPYNVPFRFAAPSPRVLIVGSGTGNDVAAALRHDSRSVDAVEIDPAILDLGKREHPEHPYDSPRVSIHLDDARSFLKRTNLQYDLILFGLLDSHAQFSDYSNLRIDNFVYTEEAFREAAAHLAPDGIIFVKFSVERPWLATRLSEMLLQALGTSPVIFRADSEYSLGGTCFVGSHFNRVSQILTSDPALAAFVRQHTVLPSPEAVPITTDDWPYLYQRDRRIPRTYYSVSILVILIATVLYALVGRANRTHGHFSLFFFSMGAGFLLLETQIISRLALFFGTVWQVSGIVISALLLVLLLANAMANSAGSLHRFWIWLGLLATLAIAYWFPFDRIGASPTTGGIVAIAVFSVPVLFAGVLFSAEFRNTISPSGALNANVLGAVTGGLLESLSLVYGLRALLLVAIVLYCMAGLGLWRSRELSG